MKISYETLTCKLCGSRHIVRDGVLKGVQRWECRDCGRKFLDNDALPGMKTPTNQISSALGMYYEGMSQNAIRSQLLQEHNNYPSDSTVYEWISNFSKKATEKAVDYKPNVGDVWVADETVLKIGGRNVWFWDIIDSKTRFLLASHISTKRNISDAQLLMKKAQIKVGKIPKVILTDKLNAYLEGVERAWGGDTKHIASKGFMTPPNTNLIERFHSTLKQRTKVMRGLKDIKSARLIMNAWLVHYNYFRPHEGLNNKTPAEQAGIIQSPKNWADIVGAQRENREPVKITLQTIPRISKRLQGYSPMIRITPRMPRISHKMPRLSRNSIYVGQGMYSRHPFRGARRISRRLI